MTKESNRNKRLILLFFFLLALSARLLHMILDPLLVRDSIHYLILAERWQETGQYAQVIEDGIIVPPLPLFLIAKLMNFDFSAEIAGRSLSLFLGSLIPVLGYQLSYKLFSNKHLSFVAGFLLVFHPILISYSIQPLRENYYLYFLGLAIIEAVNGIQKKRMIYWGICGVLLSFALFCRYESWELLIICPLVLLFLFLKNKINRKELSSFLAVFFVAMLGTSCLLLSTIDFDISFITKVSRYKDRVIQQNNVRDYLQVDPQSNE